MPNTATKEAAPGLDLGSAPEEAPASNLPATRKQKADVAAPANFLAVLAKAASDPKVDAGKMRELLEMQKEISQEESRRSFVRAYMAMQKTLPKINKDGMIEIKAKDDDGKRRENSRVQQATPFATFNNIMRGIKKPMEANGFAISFGTEPSSDGTRLIVKGFLDHEDGHQRVTAFPLPAEVSGSKNNVQGWGSSLSYGKRYCTIALLNIISEAGVDEDNDGHFAADASNKDNSAEKITTKQAEELIKAIDDCGVGGVRFCRTYEIEKVADLPASRYEEAKQNCANYKAAAQARH